MCNLRGCEDPGAHLHLRKRDERVIADVLLAEHFRRQAEKIRRQAGRDRENNQGEQR
jgi:hypothetical protein